MKLLRTMCALALMTGALMSGCSQNHPTDDVSAGIYELTVAADADACSPTRAVGSMGPVGVVVRGTAIDAPVPDVASPTLLTAPRVILNADSFHAETNRRIPGCADAFVHEEWTLLESTGAGFELLHTQLWTGMSGCDVAADVMPGAPAADCQSERRLRYDLMEVCAEPCRLFLDASGSVSCSC